MKCYRKTKKIFVGGLSSDTGKTALRNYFEQFGPIYDISIPINYYSKQSKGFAFIQFEHQNSVEKVLTHHKSHCVDGKFIECKCAIYRDEMKVEQIIPKEADTFSSESEKEEEYTTNKVFNQETLDAKRIEKRTKKDYFDEESEYVPKREFKEAQPISKNFEGKNSDSKNWQHDLYASTQDQSNAKYSDYYYSDQVHSSDPKEYYSKYTQKELNRHSFGKDHKKYIEEEEEEFEMYVAKNKLQNQSGHTNRDKLGTKTREHKPTSSQKPVSQQQPINNSQNYSDSRQMKKNDQYTRVLPEKNSEDKNPTKKSKILRTENGSNDSNKIISHLKETQATTEIPNIFSRDINEKRYPAPNLIQAAASSKDAYEEEDENESFDNVSEELDYQEYLLNQVYNSEEFRNKTSEQNGHRIHDYFNSHQVNAYHADNRPSFTKEANYSGNQFDPYMAQAYQPANYDQPYDSNISQYYEEQQPYDQNSNSYYEEQHAYGSQYKQFRNVHHPIQDQYDAQRAHFGQQYAYEDPQTHQDWYNLDSHQTQFEEIDLREPQGYGQTFSNDPKHNIKNVSHGSLKKYPPKSNLNTKTENFYLDPQQDNHSGTSSDKDGMNHHYSQGFQRNNPHQYAGDFDSSFKQGQQQFSNSTLSTYDFESSH